MNHRDTEDTENGKAETTGRDPLTEKVIGLAIEVHRALGPGLLESAYQACLHFELVQAGFDVKREVVQPVSYKGLQLDCGYRMDLVIGHELIIETKAIEKILPIHKAQLLTYMRLSGIRKGLLSNFNVPVLKNGIVRMVL